MNANVCSICKKPIIGYFHEIGKNVVCQSCSAFTTVYDLYQNGILEIKPDIIEAGAIVYADTDSIKVEKDDAEK